DGFLLTKFEEPPARLEIGEIVEHFFHRRAYPLGLLVVETAAARVILGKLETAERHTVEIGDQALIFQRELGLISGLCRVTREDQLAEARRCGEPRRGAAPRSTLDPRHDARARRGTQ